MREAWGKSINSPIKYVDFLIVGQSPGSKVKKADEFGVKQIFEEEFKALIDYDL